MHQDALAGTESGEAIIRFVHQPLIDVGVATITAFSERETPEQVTREDLEAFIGYLIDKYTKEPMKSFLSSIYPNSAYVNPTMGDDKRKATMARYLRGYATPASDPSIRCAYCGRLACDVVYRQHIPLTAGEGQINFGPGGRPGVRVCGGCLLGSQAFPLGSKVKCAGRALLVHSDNPDFTLAFANDFLQENRQILQLAGAADEAKISYPRTIVVSELVKIQQERRSQAMHRGSLTAYHLTNYGTNPDVKILHLPSHVVDFLRTVQGDMYRQAWQSIVARAWIQPKEAKGKKGKESGENERDMSVETTRQATERIGTRRNSLYDDLFDLFALPQNLGRFVRRYFLRYAGIKGATVETDITEHLGMGTWALTDVFLRKVVKMERHRIEAIREVGDRLVAVISGNNDAKLLASLYKASRYPYLCNILVKESTAQVKAGHAPIIGFEEFITIFEVGEDLPRPDWSLARDLLYIRVLDGLYKEGWFARNAETAREVLSQLEEADSQRDEQDATAVAR